MFQTDLYQSSLSVYKVNNVGSFKLYKESIIVLAFLINFRTPPNLDQYNITSANFCPEMDTIRISLLHSQYPISYNKKYISHFCYLSVKS